MSNINLTKMSEVNTLNLTTGDLTDSKSVIDTMFQTANDLVGGIWFEASMTLIFLSLIWILYKRDGDFIIDAARAGFIASGWTLLLSVAIVLSGWTVSIRPIIWFGVLFFVTGIIVYSKKEKGL